MSILDVTFNRNNDYSVMNIYLENIINTPPPRNYHIEQMSISVVLFLTHLHDGMSISNNVNVHVLFNRNIGYSKST